MEHLKPMLFPDTPLQTLLTIRPMAMHLLETWGIDPYSAPSAKAEDLCRISGLDWKTVLLAFDALETPARDSEWDKLPLYHFLDFLTHEHRVFVHEFIPAVRNAFLAGEGRQDYLGLLHPLILAWPAFSASLIGHIADEEAFLFPRIMHYEYHLRHGGTAPDFSEGSVRVFAAVHLMRAEQKQISLIREFLDASRYSRLSEEMEGAAQAVFRLLQAFHQRLLEHSRMEREILFPLAGSMEKQVYDRCIDGEPARQGHASRGYDLLP
jgi:iron-sulfur cluster repair protein YtfE (RIC family)